MNVLSLFDGISCGHVALDRVGIKINNYYASEIDKYAIQVAQNNYPNTIQLGDIKSLTTVNNIDLLIGGSPCQGFSFQGKGLNFEDPRSKLFFEYVRILKETKPKYFLLENVKMKKEYQDIISKYLGVEPIEINSNLVSAQNRVRLYWTNIQGMEQPKDKGIGLNDILESNEYIRPAAIRGRNLNKENFTTQCLEVRSTNTNKSNCLTTVEKDNVLTSMPIGHHANAYKDKLPFRYYTVKEYCRLQTVSDNYMDGCSNNKAKKMLGNGWTVDVLAYILSFMEK